MCDSESVLEEYVDGIDDEVSVADDGESFNESSFVEHSFLDGVVKEGGREEDGIFDQVHEIFGANAPALFNGQLVGITSVSDVDMNLLDDEHFAQNVPVSTTENSSSPGSSSIKKSNKRISSTHTPTVTTSSSPSYEEITASTCRLESEIFSRLSELPDIQDMTVEQVAKCIVEMEVEELRREGQRMKGLFSSTVAKLLTN